MASLQVKIVSLVNIVTKLISGLVSIVTRMEVLNRMNPWWFYDNWDSKDKNLREWSIQSYRWVPGWIREISITPFSLNFVYGPRQVGKTTGLKLFIKELIRGGVSPLSIYYLDLDYVTSLTEFRRMIEDLLRVREGRSRDSGGSFIILDEVTSIEGWWKVLKFFIDEGVFSNDVIIVSGSSTVGITKVPERFPGRRGLGRDIVVLPLSFPEFVSVKGYRVEDLLYNTTKAQALFDEYKRVGGFPRSINNNPDAEEAVVDGLLSEVYKNGRSPRIVQDILYSLLGKIPSAISYNSIAQDVGISHNTVGDYMEFLEDLLIIHIAYLKRNNEVVRRKEKKVFFRDPFLLRAISNWVNREFNSSAIIEGVVQEHLLRMFGEIYYYRDDHEIDAIANGYRVEVKSERSRKKYPREVTILTEEEIPIFLLQLWQQTRPRPSNII